MTKSSPVNKSTANNRIRRAPPLEVLLSFEVADADPMAAGWLEEQLCRAAAFAGIGGEISILVVGDRRMARLHLEHKQVPGTTDCLTFDLSGPNTPKGFVEGDLVLCMAVARRQARKRGHSTREELLLYAVHGLLHLAGEDDLNPAAFEKMHAREDAILQAIGLGPLFAGKSDVK